MKEKFDITGMTCSACSSRVEKCVWPDKKAGRGNPTICPIDTYIRGIIKRKERIGYGLGHQNMELVAKYHMDLYFESATMILALITFGKYLEARSKLEPRAHYL